MAEWKVALATGLMKRAIHNEQWDMVKLLYERGFVIKKKNRQTAMCLWKMFIKFKSDKAVLNFDADLAITADVVDSDGNTPLYLAW